MPMPVTRVYTVSLPDAEVLDNLINGEPAVVYFLIPAGG